MSTDPTNYHRPLDPTQAVRYNPYEQTSPYGDIPPPPPPRRKKPWLLAGGVLLLIVVVTLAVGAGVLLGHGTPGAAQSTVTPASTPTVGVTPTPTPAPKTALDILADMQQVGLQPYQVSSQVADCYGRAPAGLVSVVCFRNPEVCNLGCDEDMVTLTVFDTQADAQNHYQLAVQATGGPYYPAIIEGYCVLDGIINNGKYVQVLKNDCM